MYELIFYSSVIYLPPYLFSTYLQHLTVIVANALPDLLSEFITLVIVLAFRSPTISSHTDTFSIRRCSKTSCIFSKFCRHCSGDLRCLEKMNNRLQNTRHHPLRSLPPIPPPPHLTSVHKHFGLIHMIKLIRNSSNIYKLIIQPAINHHKRGSLRMRILMPTIT